MNASSEPSSLMHSPLLARAQSIQTTAKDFFARHETISIVLSYTVIALAALGIMALIFTGLTFALPNLTFSVCLLSLMNPLNYLYTASGLLSCAAAIKGLLGESWKNL